MGNGTPRLTMASGTGRNPPGRVWSREPHSFQIYSAQRGKEHRMEKVTVRLKGGMVTEVTATSSEIETVIIDEDAFDLPAFLLGEIYPHMNETEKESWCRKDAEDLVHDLEPEGIEADVDEVYEIIAEFIRQDAEEL
jgi:hypothetical protein